jgi:predicted amidohydrolase YtcJ
MPISTDITLIENARIYTMDKERSQATTLAIQNGFVLGVGTQKIVSKLGNVTHRVDLEGRAIIPGLIDAHIHFLDYSRSLSKVNLDGVSSKQEVLSMVADKAREVGPGKWVLGGGWNNNLWSPPDFPTRQDLDRVAPNNPVYLDRKDLHSCWVNTLALQKAGVTSETPDPPEAAIGRDDAGDPNGLFYESAVRLMRRAIDEPPEDAKTSMRRGFDALLSMGLTGFHDCEGPDAFAAFQELDSADGLSMRVVILLPFYKLDEAIELGLKTGFGSERLRVGPVKIFSDGSLGSMTAQMLEPYEGRPGNYGISTIDQSVLEEAIKRAAEAGIPCAIHAIGDAANRRVLDAFAKAQSPKSKVQSQANDLGPWTLDFGLVVNRIEHAQLLHPDDVPRFAQLGVVASMQPIHATSDMHAADRLWGARARYGYAWRSLLDAGALVAFGSDAPVETPNPFMGIHAAVTRQDGNDLPEGGWYPEERISVEEAVRAYTESAARSAPYLPHVTGTLTPGSVADLLVLDRDIFAIEPKEIKDARPLVTMVAGAAVHDPECIFQV